MLGRLNVRCLQALVALHDLELHALTLGQRLVAVHRDRGEVNEHVVTTLALDETKAFLVRKPLDGAFSQLRAPYWMTMPSVDRRNAGTIPRKFPACKQILRHNS